MRSDRNVGPETRDIRLGGAAWLGAFVFALAALAGLLMLGLFRYFAAREAGRQGVPTSLVRPAGPAEPPAPRLQPQPTRDLVQMRAEETESLTTYGWVDSKTGVVRIPIDRAMDLLLERGLPARAATEGQEAKP